MKHKILELIAFILFVGSIGYIMGQDGALRFGDISIELFVIRSGIGIVVLGFDTWLINHLGREELD